MTCNCRRRTSRSELEFEAGPDPTDEFEMDSTPGFIELGDRDFEVIGADDRRRITNTRDTPFRYICSIRAGNHGCSGTLVGPSTVLTAGHCVEDLTGSVTVIPGRAGNSRPFGSAIVTSRRRAPGYVRGSRTDYGLMFLDKPLGASAGWWTVKHTTRTFDQLGTSMLTRSLPLPAGTLGVNISGYPCDVPTTDPANWQMWDYDRTVRLSGGILEYLNDTFGCMSGSPVWVKRHGSLGGRVLVAVHITGDSPEFPGKANRGVFLAPSVVDFIAKNRR